MGGGRGKDDDEEKESETKALRSATPQSCQTFDSERSITAGDLLPLVFLRRGGDVYLQGGFQIGRDTITIRGSSAAVTLYSVFSPLGLLSRSLIINIS